MDKSGSVPALELVLNHKDTTIAAPRVISKSFLFPSDLSSSS